MADIISKIFADYTAEELNNKLNDLNADNVLMSGSGSTVFALSENKNQIDELFY